MNTYTTDDVMAFAQLYQDCSPATTLTPEEVAKFGGNFSYVDLMKDILKEKKLPGASILEFIGAYEAVGTTPEKWEMVRQFLFETPLRDMPKRINDSGDDLWRNRVAQWRLQIGK